MKKAKCKSWKKSNFSLHDTSKPPLLPFVVIAAVALPAEVAFVVVEATDAVTCELVFDLFIGGCASPLATSQFIFELSTLMSASESGSEVRRLPPVGVTEAAIGASAKLFSLLLSTNVRAGELTLDDLTTFSLCLSEGGKYSESCFLFL